MAGAVHGRRKIGLGKKAAAIATTAVAATVVAAAVVTVAAWPVSGSLAAPRPDRTGSSSGAPAGWAPVLYQRAQLSVPGRWVVQTPSDISCAPQPGGMIFAGIRPGIPHGDGCGLTASYAWIIPAGHIPAGISHRKPTAVINGLPVYQRPARTGSVLYLVPELRIRVGAHGPLARRVLATLNESPLAVVLAKGAAGKVPAGWARYRFGGVTFSAPRRWHRYRQTRWETCGTGVDWRTVLLINAIKPPLALPCPARFPYASAFEA
jgi:hypothetical protein